MNNLITDFFKKFGILRLNDFVDLYSICSLKTYRAGELITQKGEFFEYSIGIRKGIIRTYILAPSGEEKTVRFAKEGDFAGCSDCLLQDAPSTEFLEAVEDCKVILIHSGKIKALARENIRLLRVWNDATNAAFLDAVRRIEFFVTLTPEERYRHLLAESPELLHRVPQKYLASYIGVTTVSLSRIRSRVALKN